MYNNFFRFLRDSQRFSGMICNSLRYFTRCYVFFRVVLGFFCDNLRLCRAIPRFYKIVMRCLGVFFLRFLTILWDSFKIFEIFHGVLWGYLCLFDTLKRFIDVFTNSFELLRMLIWKFSWCSKHYQRFLQYFIVIYYSLVISDPFAKKFSRSIPSTNELKSSVGLKYCGCWGFYGSIGHRLPALLLLHLLPVFLLLLLTLPKRLLPQTTKNQF